LRVKPLYPLFDGTSASKHEAGGIAKDGAKMVILRCKKRLTSGIRRRSIRHTNKYSHSEHT
jgi:hypothetical protein